MYKNTSHDKIFGKLPNAFEKRDGSKMTDTKDWADQRNFLLEKTLPLLCGGMPPKPEVIKVSQTCAGNYIIYAGTKEKTLSFEMQIRMPEKSSGPVLICGDPYAYCNDEVIKEAHGRGFTVVKFNRCALAGDNYKIDRNHGLYLIYPELKFSAIAAWAWGYQRCVDALEILGINTENVAVAGHSRGGKTTCGLRQLTKGSNSYSQAVQDLQVRDASVTKRHSTPKRSKTQISVTHAVKTLLICWGLYLIGWEMTERTSPNTLAEKTIFPLICTS
ncbi:MAG: hypothetical protein E7481_10165 [Ruminococcaceae bacterium]|nr:hypothetical protein [Oscillospiraceae bacterium]